MIWHAAPLLKREMGSQICGRHPDGPSTPGCRQVLRLSHRAVACSSCHPKRREYTPNHPNHKHPKWMCCPSTKHHWGFWWFFFHRDVAQPLLWGVQYKSNGRRGCLRRWHGQWMAWGAVDGQVSKWERSTCSLYRLWRMPWIAIG